MKLSEKVTRKFVEQFDVTKWEVESDSGYVPITKSNKTIQYQIYHVMLESGLCVECADTHILIDINGAEVFAKDSLGVYIRTKFGDSKVTDVLATNKFANMYDLTVDSADHTYYTNNILSHNTITTAAYFLWVVLFNADKNIAILANKAAMAREILSRIQLSYELLPLWLQQGVMEWNKGSIKLENNSKIFTSATSPNAIRGNSCSHVYADEIAFVPSNIAEEFMTSVFPVLSSGKETKIFVTSTPRGMNMFHKLWTEAENGKNGFVPVRISWTENPDRDLAWLDEQRRVLGEVKFNQEILVEFHGSSNTLVDGKKLSQIAFDDPVFEKDKLKIYKKPVPGNSYVCTVDTSRGQHLDYSAFVIIDTTAVPYEVVATFKDNTISSMSYPYMIINTCRQFNDAYCLIEVNDIGGEVANIIFYEFEYPNVYFTSKELLTEGQGYPGVRTTKKVKAVGCSVLKELVEQDQLQLHSIDIIQELAVFGAKGSSYAAEDTKINDDLTACLFLFAWLTKQNIFKDITNTNIRAILARKNEEYILEQMTPFGFIDDGMESLLDTIGSSGQPRDISGTSMSIDDWIMS